MSFIFLAINAIVYASLMDRRKVIVLQNDKSRMIVGIDQIIRLRSKTMPDGSSDGSVFRLLEAKTGYHFKYNRGFLCRKNREDNTVIGCPDNETDLSIWRLSMNGKAGTKIQTDDGLCLIPAKFDKREKTRGNRLQAMPCNNESAVWLLVDLPDTIDRLYDETASLIYGSVDQHNGSARDNNIMYAEYPSWQYAGAY